MPWPPPPLRPRTRPPESGTGLGFTGVEGITGLTAAEVAEREGAGLVNVQSRDTSRSLGQILRVHVFTLFNLAIALCAVVVILMGRWLDLLFSLAAVANVVIGVVQEYSAKRKLDRIALLHQDDVVVIRDGRACPCRWRRSCGTTSWCCAAATRCPWTARSSSRTAWTWTRRCSPARTTPCPRPPGTPCSRARPSWPARAWCARRRWARPRTRPG